MPATRISRPQVSNDLLMKYIPVGSEVGCAPDLAKKNSLLLPPSNLHGLSAGLPWLPWWNPTRLAQNAVPILAKTKRSKVTADSRPIANIRLMYNFFAYLVLGHIEEPLEHLQPEEKHGFTRNRRIEEHLLTANMVIDKTWLANTPLWIVNLDLSTVFECVDWKSSWKVLRPHGVIPHLISLLQMTFANQKGQAVSNNDTTHEFDICAGVRQGCVLNSRLFCPVLQLAMGRCRNQVEHFGLNLGDGMSHVLDLRFADDILLFGESGQALGSMLDALVICPEQSGIETQRVQNGSVNNASATTFNIDYARRTGIGSLEGTKAHKWLGCLLPTWATDNKRWTIVYKAFLEHFKLTNRYCVTKMCR